MRITHPSFKLLLAPLSDAFQEGKMKQFVDFSRSHSLLQKLKFNSEQMPVALRWNMHPEFGFPRQPFSVYRRIPDYSKFQTKPILPDGSVPILFLNEFLSDEDLYLMVVTVTLTAGQQLVLTPLGKGGIVIGNKTITVTQSGTVLFKSPFMRGVKCEGQGTMNRIIGIRQSDIINSSNWDKIQTVGLPFPTGEVKGEGYNGDPQGINPHAMLGAKDAALLRLLIGQFFATKPASLTSIDSQVPDVNWQFPDPTAYLNFLNNGPESQLEIIKSCLEKSKDQSWNPSRRQPAYVFKTTIDGISQPGTGATGTEAEVLLPVVAQTLLSISTESPAAVGLGFGTYDFIEPAKNARSTSNESAVIMSRVSHNQSLPLQTGFMDLSCDYMVGANYIIRPSTLIEIPFLDQVSKTTEFCALGDEMPRLVQVDDLELIGLRMNRPERIDLTFTESLKLRWKKPIFSSSYAIAKSYSPGRVVLENDQYPFNPNARIGIFSPVPKDQSGDWENADHGKPIHTLPEEPVPLVGNQRATYFMAPIDVFGRWGPWIRKNHIAFAPKPQKPGLMSVRLVLPNGEDTSGYSPEISQVECRLEIEFSWDWIDRSPSRIEFVGKFFSASLQEPSGPVPGNFAKSDPSSGSEKIVISFSNAGINQTPNTTMGTVSLMESSIPTDSSGNQTVGSQDSPAANLRKYKLIIADMTATFTGVAPYEVAYALYARGLERVRVSADDWSPWLEVDPSLPESQRDRPSITRLPDPRPPAVTTVLADVQFTALPDNTRKAKGTLTWGSASGALFYHVWEASESAIRGVLEKELKTRFSSSSDQQLLPFTAGLIARATQIKDLLDQAEYMNLCQNTFSRITKKPLTERSFQLEIPGGTEALMIYSISSVNSANVESGKSNRAFFAVPKIEKPASPILQLTNLPTKYSPAGTAEGIEVKVINNGPIVPEGYRLFRIRKMPFNNDVGGKGLPILRETDAAWEDATLQLPDGTSLTGKKMVDTGIPRSWKPIVYQAVAIGKDNPANGVYGGESDSSGTKITWLPPTVPPSILLLAAASNAFGRRATASTSITFESIPLGRSVIQVLELNEDGSRQKIHEFHAEETGISENTLELPLNAAALAEFPKITRKKAILATGMTEFSIVIPLNPKPLILRIIDPMNRASEIAI